ncbi:MAG: hypothetical protein D6750_03670 [Bacteroidetes bacterium]|nr:MAG: hypothetical protein D6750_03670 [Bacteroidota bacterium]
MKIVYFGQGGATPSPEVNGYVVMPYAGEHIETPLFKANRVVNLYPSAYALYQIYEVKEMNTRFEELVQLIEGLRIRPNIKRDMEYTVVPIEPDMIEEALSWGAVGFGIEVFGFNDVELIALFPAHTMDGDNFAETNGFPTDFLFGRMFRTFYSAPLQWGDITFYLDEGVNSVAALFTGGLWAVYLR